MNARNPSGAVNYRTPTTPPSGNPTRLLRAEPRTIPQLTKGQLIMARHRRILGEEASPEDLHETMNRHEKRVIKSEARQYVRAKAKRDALKKKRDAQRVVWEK